MTERYGQYELIKRLATGGMAQIYLARQHGMEGFERLCVVKRILPHLAENEDFIQMFLDEARIAARLSHTNIVQVFDLGHLDDSYFIAMEYIHGEDLRRMWRKAESRGELLPIPFVLRVIADAASGLDYAHKRTDNGRPLNIVHRDISPQNILVSFEGTVKVVDFGIAKAADKATHTRSGVLKGKYSYMSPEQAVGDRAVDHRTDVFALGIVLYELLTGTRLFKRTNDVQTLTAVMNCEVAPPSEVHDRVPKDLDAVVLKALTKLADDRYPDAMGFQLALENWLISHQQPASTAHVAGYLRELYAERLAEEAKQGGPLSAEELVRSSEEDLSPRKRTPSSRSGRPSGSSASSNRSASREASVGLSSRAAPPPSEATTSLRPERSSRSGMKVVPRAPTVSLRGGSASSSAVPGGGGVSASASRQELSPQTNPRVTEVSRTQAQPKRTLVAAAAALVLVGGAAALVWATAGDGSEPVPPARIFVESDPPGATLVFDGVAVAELSPAVLPPKPPGQYPLLVGKADHREVRLTVDVPRTGEVQLPRVTLLPLASQTRVEEKDAGPPGAQTVTAVGVGKPPQEREVSLVVATEPAGAQVTVDGKRLGASPAVVSVRPGTQVQVRAELAGHVPVERKLRVGTDGLRETLKLERRRQAPSGNQTQQADPNPPRMMGQVQFVIMPLGAGAEVSCGSHKLGSFPSPPKSLPAGTYQCTFSNPELGTRTERVEVRGNSLERVTVRFN